MAKVKIKGIDRVERALKRSIKIETRKLFRDKELRQKIGEMVVDDIKENVDFGLASPATQRARRYLEQFNSTDPKYDRRKIKALFTGQLIDDLGKNIKSDTNNLQFVIEHSEKNRKKYKKKRGTIGKTMTNQELSKILINDLGYDYILLSDKARSEITELVRDKLTKLIKDINKGS